MCIRYEDADWKAGESRISETMSECRKIEDVLSEEGVFVSTTVGFSMYPMLRNRKDTIIVCPYEGRLKKYDVPLYKRGSDYILHRVLEVRPDSYVMCGDNCIQKEYGITEDQILGVLTGFYRGKRQVNMDGWLYKVYVRCWCGLFPLRRIWKRGRYLLEKFMHRGKRRNTGEWIS